MTTTFPAQLPAIRNFAECRAWLATVPVDDSGAACEAFIAMLGQLEDIPPRPGPYLDVLECMREPARAAQADQTRAFAGTPQPLARDALAAYDRVTDLGAALARAYRALLREHLDGVAPELQRRVALLCQRSMESLAELMAAAWRARREIDHELWRRLHETYRLAEERGVARERVSRSRSEQTMPSVAELYVRALLIHLAQPYALAPREFQWLRRWAGLWAGKVSLEAELADAAQGFAVDLNGDAPPGWTPADAAAPAVRFLNARPLYRSVVSRLKRLRKGDDPADLGLGDDCGYADATRLLQGAYRCWFDNPAPRAPLRRTSAGMTALVPGIDAAHQLVIQPCPAGIVTEQWDTVGESATTFRLRRHGSDARLCVQQLVGLRPPGARAVILCFIESLMTGADGALELGARAFPGVARPATVRVRDGARGGELPAFFLPEVPGEPASLVLPEQAAATGRMLQLDLDGAVRDVRVEAVVQQGHDFARATIAYGDA